MVQTLADADPDELEPVIHRNLRVAASCIGDYPGLRRSVAESLLARLTDIVEKLPYEALPGAFEDAATALSRLRPSDEQVIERLVRISSFQGAWEPRMASARLLGNIADRSTQAMQTCNDLLEDDDPDVRAHAAFGLVKAGDDRAFVWNMFLARYDSQYTRMEADSRSFVANTQVRRLLDVAAQPEIDIARLVALLHDAGRDSEEVVAILTERLGDMPDSEYVLACSALMDRDSDISQQTGRLIALVRPECAEAAAAARLLLKFGLPFADLEDPLLRVVAEGSEGDAASAAFNIGVVERGSLAAAC